jgi:hypothetical protein
MLSAFLQVDIVGFAYDARRRIVGEPYEQIGEGDAVRLICDSEKGEGAGGHESLRVRWRDTTSLFVKSST